MKNIGIKYIYLNQFYKVVILHAFQLTDVLSKIYQLNVFLFVFKRI